MSLERPNDGFKPRLYATATHKHLLRTQARQCDKTSRDRNQYTHLDKTLTDSLINQ